MSVDYKKQTHKSKGKAGKTPHPSGMSPHSGARKNKLTKALREREEEVAQRKMKKNKPRPKKKPTPPEVPTIEPKQGPFKIRVGKGKEDPTDTELKSEFLNSLKNKKYGGKINYRMGGGQVVDASYD